MVERFNSPFGVGPHPEGLLVLYSDYEAELAKAKEANERLRGALKETVALADDPDLDPKLHPQAYLELVGVQDIAEPARHALAQDKPARYGGPGCGPCNERFDQPIPSKGIKKALADAGIEDEPLPRNMDEIQEHYGSPLHYLQPDKPLAGAVTGAGGNLVGVEPKCGTCGGRRLSPPLVCPDCQGEAKVCVWNKNKPDGGAGVLYYRYCQGITQRAICVPMTRKCPECGRPVKVRE